MLSWPCLALTFAAAFLALQAPKSPLCLIWASTDPLRFAFAQRIAELLLTSAAVTP